jgi:hypothetical protein
MKMTYFEFGSSVCQSFAINISLNMWRALVVVEALI